LCYFAPHQVIETCPGVFVKNLPENELKDYVFGVEGGGYVSAYSLCSLYNHSDAPNARWQVEGTNGDPNSWKVIITASRHIHPGDEIFISYGTAYWKSRGITPV
jgi:SET domain-containing protein